MFVKLLRYTGFVGSVISKQLVAPEGYSLKMA